MSFGFSRVYTAKSRALLIGRFESSCDRRTERQTTGYTLAAGLAQTGLRRPKSTALCALSLCFTKASNSGHG